MKDHFGDLVEVNEERNVIEWKGERLDGMIDRASRRVNGETFDQKLKAISFGKVDAKLAERIKEVIAFDTRGFKLNLAEDDAFHILDTHGEGRELMRDQRAITSEDFYYMLTSWRNPDSILDVADKRKPFSVKTLYDFNGTLMGFLWNMIKGQKVLNLTSMYAKK